MPSIKKDDLFVNPAKGQVFCKVKGGASVQIKAGAAVPVASLDEASVKELVRRGHFVTYDRMHDGQEPIVSLPVHTDPNAANPGKSIPEDDLKGKSIEDLNRIAAERGHTGKPFTAIPAALVWLTANASKTKTPDSNQD